MGIVPSAGSLSVDNGALTFDVDLTMVALNQLNDGSVCDEHHRLVLTSYEQELTTFYKV